MHVQSNELRYLTFARFIFRARAKTVLKLPSYKGSTFRGGFGYNLIKIICINRADEYYRCLLISGCIYTYIFETKPPEDSMIKHSLSEAPHPYVLSGTPHYCLFMSFCYHSLKPATVAGYHEHQM